MLKNAYKSLMALALVIAPAATHAAPTLPRLAVLVPESLRPESQVIRGLRQGLKELGYQEKKSYVLEIRDAKGDRNALAKEAFRLAGQKVQIIITTGTRATRAAMEATREIPIIFSHPADPIALGLVKNPKRPGGNVSGVAAFASQKTETRMQILKEFLPALRRLLIFYDSNNPYSRENFFTAQKAAAKLGLQIEEYPIKSSEELKKSLGSLQNKQGDALFQIADDLVEGEADFLFETARQKRLPTMFNEETWAIRGALAGYGPNYYEMGRQAARMAAMILRGAKVSDVPVEAASKFDLVINFRTAKFIGLELSRETLKKADRVIR